MEVFSLEEEVRGGKTPVPFEQSAAAAAEALHQLERLLAPSSDAEAMLARHVELAAGGAHRVDCAALCAVLQRLGYSAKLHESTASLYSFKQGVRHQYITVCLPDTSRAGLSTVVVEPNFRDCFCIAHPTPRFEALLDGTPSAVVASKAAMHRAVGILAREMARSFSDRGEELPPWRTPQALLSKWQLGSGSAAAATGAGCSAWAAQGYPAAAGNLFATKHHAAFGAA
ncbi:hypothetical protein ABPG75_005914 [Micractinium tetrahymenae]